MNGQWGDKEARKTMYKANLKDFNAGRQKIRKYEKVNLEF